MTGINEMEYGFTIRERFGNVFFLTLSVIIAIVPELNRNFPKIIQAGGKILTSLVSGIIAVLGKVGNSEISDSVSTTNSLRYAVLLLPWDIIL